MPSAEGRPRILIVDDEESYRDALMAGFSQERFAVELARDGLEALQKFEAYSPEIVLLDVMLPGMRGTEVCRRMRDLAPVPIIMVSALDSEVDVVLGLELGAVDYVTKPFSFRELLARVRTVLRRYAPTLPPVSPISGQAQSRLEVVIAGPVRLDLARREVWVKNAFACRGKSSTSWPCCCPR